MSPIRRPPPNAEYPPEVVCKWCGNVRANHCTRRIKHKDGSIETRRNRKCSWYPCRECEVVTYLSGFHKTDEGRWAWTVNWRKVAKSWFV